MAALLEARLTPTTPGLDVLRSVVTGLRWLALCSLVGGTLLTVSVPVLAWTSGGRPGVLIWYIESGLRIGLGLIAVVIFVDCLLLSGAVLAALYVLLGPITGIVAGAGGIFLIGGIAAALAFAASARRNLGLGTREAAGVDIGRDDQPRLWAFVNEVARRLRVDPPDNLVIGTAAEPILELGDVKVQDRQLSGVTFHFGLPALARLSEAELRAVVAGNLAFLRSSDRARVHAAVYAFGRLISAYAKSSREPYASLLALPAHLWIAYVIHTLVSVVGAAEADEALWAEALAADAVGSTLLEEGRAALANAAREQAEWDKELTGAGRGASTAGLKDLLTRAGAAGVGAGDIGDGGQSALDLVDDVDGLLARLVGAAQPGDSRSKGLILNSPRIGWFLLIWLAFGALILLGPWPTILRGTTGGVRNTTLVLVIAWLAASAAGMLIAREVRLMPKGVLVRSWARILATRQRELPDEVTLRWTSDFSLRVGFDQILTLSDGRRRATVWGEAWPEHETRSLVAALRERNVRLEFSRTSGDLDDQRVVVIWRYGHSLLLPKVQRNGERIVETAPVAVVEAALDPLSRALAMPMRSRVASGAATPALTPSDLSSLVDANAEQFAERASRIVLEGSWTGWSIVADGYATWRRPQFKLPPAIAAAAILDAFRTDELDGDNGEQWGLNEQPS